MDEEKKETTIFVDAETKRKLAVISKLAQRSMAGQLRYWVNQAYAGIEVVVVSEMEKDTADETEH